MRRFTLYRQLAVLWVLTMTATALALPASAELFLPPAGEDVFPASKARFDVEILILEETLSIVCSGPTTVRRSDPDPTAGVIQTEMVSMSLSCSDGIKVHLSPDQVSPGEIQPNGDSFFDIFIEVEVPGFPPLRNVQPARVQSTIGHIPPLGSVYLGVGAVDLVLPDGQPFARLVHVEHDVNGVPKPETSGEFSQVFSCFYECKTDRRGSNWLEVTSLMLVNQTARIPLLAEIFFLDGNQRPIAQTRTDLSPLDLDEINVCETLEQGLAAPGLGATPPAGVIEVVLSPTGGAYGWVKDVVGKFKKGNVEPFDGTVNGIGKTECRLVGPNVTTPFELRQRLANAPAIDAILIEQTGE